MKLTKQRLCFLIACFLMPLGLYAQTPTLKVTVPNVVAEGERFQVVFEINIDGAGSFNPPTQWDNVNVVAGPNQRFMQTNVNGKVSAVTEVIYVVDALKEGKIAIAGASVDVNGKRYNFEAKEIKVIKGNSSSNASGNDMFIRVAVSKSALYKGDQLVAVLKLYFRGVNVHRFEDPKLPAFDGFYKQELELTDQNVQREDVNGTIYNVYVLSQYILYPQRAGSLRIEPADITVLGTIPSSRPSMNPFYPSEDETVRKKLLSAAVTINVKDLPPGAPASFNGAVGNFKLETSLSKDMVTANNAVTYTTKISGTGNFKLFTMPKASFPVDFEVYDPKTTENVKISMSGFTGSRSSEATIIPRSAGSYTISPTVFTYFNPDRAEYITLQSKEHTLTVMRDSTSAQPITGSATTRQQDIRHIGEDIRANKLGSQSWRMAGSSFFYSMTYYSLYILTVVLFIIVIFVLRERAKRRKNVVQTRNRKANSVAKKRLSKAGRLLKAGDIACFYEELLKASWGYLGDKFNIPVASLSRDNVREVLSNKNVDVEDVGAFIAVVDECEFARYAPGTGHTEMERIYDNAINVISKLEQKIR